MCHSCQRRRVQHRRQPVRLLPPADRRGDGDGGLPDRRADRRAACAPWGSRRSTRCSSTTARGARTWRSSTAISATACAPPVVFYNRANEAAARAAAGRLRLGGNLRRRCPLVPQRRNFRVAVATTTAELIIEGMTAAKRHGAVVSFDLNYREKLWSASGGPARAQATLNRIVEHVDVLVGNEEDLQKGLGMSGPEVAALSKLDPSAFFGMIDRVVAKYPQIKVVATTLRDVHSTNRHTLGRGRLDQRRDVYRADLRSARLRPRRRRRWLCVRVVLRLAHRCGTRRVGATRVVARRPDRRLSRRHDDGDARAGPCLRARRVVPDSTMTISRNSSRDTLEGGPSLGTRCSPQAE